jgi:RimJ/RimL family protein N-acetyltransferase
VRTERLRLRPWAEADAPAFHRIWGDPDVIFWGPAKDLEESRAILVKVAARCAGLPPPVGWHAILEAEGGDIVGNAVLQPATYAPGDLEVGWHLRRDRWGRGYATEACRALVAEAFARLDVPRLTCVILPSNLRSQAVARRLGFRVQAHDVLHAGLPHDLWSLGRESAPRP